MSRLHSKQGWNPKFLPALCYVRDPEQHRRCVRGWQQALASTEVGSCGAEQCHRAPGDLLARGRSRMPMWDTALQIAVPKDGTRAGNCRSETTCRLAPAVQGKVQSGLVKRCWLYALLPTASAPAPQSCIPCFWLILLHLLFCSGLDSKFPSLFYRRHSPCQLLTSGPAPRLSAPY